MLKDQRPKPVPAPQFTINPWYNEMGNCRLGCGTNLAGNHIKKNTNCKELYKDLSISGGQANHREPGSVLQAKQVFYFRK